MTEKLFKTYLRYGISEDTARHLSQLSLSATTLKAMNRDQLISKFKLDEKTIDIVKHALQRQPIEEDVADLLVSRSSFVCCCCRGVRSSGILIHHITPYNETQNNTYANLAILCPACHDIAHRSTDVSLTMNLTEKQIHKNKIEWESIVETCNAEKNLMAGNVASIDFINIPRIVELAISTIGHVPETRFTASMISQRYMSKEGLPNMSVIRRESKGGRYLFDFMSAYIIIQHYYEVYINIANRFTVCWLDDLLNNKSFSDVATVGRHCIYSGGLYGSSPKTPITSATPTVSLYLRRKGFKAEWIIDPQYITSTSSIVRLSEHRVFAVYGSVRDLEMRKHKDIEMKFFDIRPYVVAAPSEYIHRRPVIAYLRDRDDEDYEEEVEGDES